MGRLREQVHEALPDRLTVHPSYLDGIYNAQYLGDALYGECLLGETSTPRRVVPTSIAVQAHIEAAKDRAPVQPLASWQFKAPEQPRKTPLVAAPPSRSSAAEGSSKRQKLESKGSGMSEMDSLIVEARKLGQSWQEIANMIPGKTAHMIRKRYNAKLKPKPKVMPALAPESALAAAPGGTPLMEGVAAPREPQIAIPRDVTPAVDPPEPKSAAGSARKKPRGRSMPPMGPVEVRHECTNHAGGDVRVQLAVELPESPEGNTVQHAHNLESLKDVRFFEEVGVVDSDEPTKIYAFSVLEPEHGACFNIGMGPDGTALISYSDLFGFYQLPDGTKWAEHGYLYDREDVEEHAKKAGKSADKILAKNSSPQELFRKAGRYHSRLHNIEYEFWIFKDRLPEESLVKVPEDNAYFWTLTFDPVTLEVVA